MAERRQQSPRLLIRPGGHLGQGKERREYEKLGRFAEQPCYFNNTYHCEETQTRQQYLLKVVYLMGKDLSTDDITRRQYELLLWPTLRHSNILTYVDGWQKEQKIYLVSSPARWSLETLLLIKGCPPPQDLFVKWLYQIASALKYLHEDHNPTQPVLHRNLKPATVLVTDVFVLKLTDFSCSKMLEADKIVTASQIGTMRIMSPEMILRRIYDCKTDIWSFGITAVYIATLRDAVKARTFDTLIKKTKSGEVRVEKWAYSEDLQNLVVNRMMHRDPKSRSSASKVIKDLQLIFGDACTKPPQTDSYPGLTSPRDPQSAPRRGQPDPSGRIETSVIACPVGAQVDSTQTDNSDPNTRAGSRTQQERPASSARSRDASELQMRDLLSNLPDVTVETLSLAIVISIGTDGQGARVGFEMRPSGQALYSHVSNPGEHSSPSCSRSSASRGNVTVDVQVNRESSSSQQRRRETHPEDSLLKAQSQSSSRTLSGTGRSIPDNTGHYMSSSGKENPAEHNDHLCRLNASVPMLYTFPGAFGVQRRPYSGPLKPIAKSTSSQKKKKAKQKTSSSSQASVSLHSNLEAGDSASAAKVEVENEFETFETTPGADYRQTRGDGTQGKQHVRPKSESDAVVSQRIHQVPPDEWEPDIMQEYMSVASDLLTKLGPNHFWTAVKLIRLFAEHEVKMWLEENVGLGAGEHIGKLQRLTNLNDQLDCREIVSVQQTLRSQVVPSFLTVSSRRNLSSSSGLGESEDLENQEDI